MSRIKYEESSVGKFGGEKRLRSLVYAEDQSNFKTRSSPAPPAQVGLDDLLVVAALGGRPLGDLDPVVEHRDAVRDVHHHVELVLDEDDRDPQLAQRADQVDQLQRLGR